MQNNTESSPSVAGMAGALWGVAGFSLIMLDAINRLAGHALEAFVEPLSLLQWLSLLVIVAVMAYTEGYRGFQKSFSPRTAARAYYLYRRPDMLGVVFAPIFCMGSFRATRAPLLFAWVGTALIVSFVIALHATPQPWRGLVDTGVVVGLSWGLVSFWVSVWRVFGHAGLGVSPEVPGP